MFTLHPDSAVDYEVTKLNLAPGKPSTCGGGYERITVITMTNETSRKYELTDISKQLDNGVTVHRIRALNDVYTSDGKLIAPKGALGGWIQGTGNLSQDDGAWVHDDATVYGSAVVKDDAQVAQQAEVSGNAFVYGSPLIYGEAKIHGRTWVSGTSWVYDKAQVFGESRLDGSCTVCDTAWVYGSVRLMNKKVEGDTKMNGAGSFVGTDFGSAPRELPSFITG